MLQNSYAHLESLWKKNLLHLNSFQYQWETFTQNYKYQIWLPYAHWKKRKQEVTETENSYCNEKNYTFKGTKIIHIYKCNSWCFLLILTSSRSLRKLLKVGTSSILVISLPRTNASSCIENANVLRTFHWKKKWIQLYSVPWLS